MPLDEITIAEALKEHGYQTFFAGKWHLGPTEEYWPTQQGFDVNRGGHRGGGPYGGKKYFSPYENPTLSNGPEGEHLPDRLARETSEFMEEHRDEPFLAYLSFYSVHTPLMAPKDLVAKYQAKAKKLGLSDENAFAEEEQVFGDKPRRVRIQQNHAVYAAMVEAMDRAVGKVLNQITKLGLDDSTAVFFIGDNGGLSTSEGSPTSNLPFRGGKGWIYEGGIREAFLARCPGVTTPGSVSSEPVCSTDFYPTILEYCGLPLKPDQHLDGQSLIPLMSGEERLSRENLFWHYPHYSNQGGFPAAALRNRDWKLIERFEDGQVHLYHLKDDPGERKDRSKDFPDRVMRMRENLHRWYREVDAKFLQPKDGQQPWRP